MTSRFHSRARGYSFTEVMFAVVVLGIGFIMIAAMFPVAIQQSQLTSEESTGAAIARQAVNYVKTIAVTLKDPAGAVLPNDKQPMPPTEASALPTRAPFFAFDKPDTGAGALANHGLWSAVKGNLILPSDPRYAFVPFYSREFASNVARLSIVAVRVRDRSTFDSTDISPDVNANLQPRVIAVKITDNVDNTGTDWAEITGGDIDAVAEGAYVVLASQVATGSTPVNHYAGQAFRIGNRATQLGATLPQPNTWELSPGNDFKPDLDSSGVAMQLPTTPMAAYIVGRERDPAAPTTFRGVAQDISFYTTFIQVTP